MLNIAKVQEPYLTIMRNLPVGLDGPLTYTDTLHESTLKLLSKQPLDVFRLPLSLYQGKASLKNKISQKKALDRSRALVLRILI